MTNFIAHVRQVDKSEQSVVTHLTEASTVACTVVVKPGLAYSRLIGLMHDFCKYSR